MLCYKDMMFCNADDCSELECERNTRGENFKPDDFWKDKICIGAIKEKCQYYKKEENDGSVRKMQNKSN